MTNRSLSDTIEMDDNSFGRRLRAERERRRISLEAIAANTKIGIGLLRGLERDDVSRWPSGIFRRSFIRSYAEAIGLDGDDTVREFVERFPEPPLTASGTPFMARPPARVATPKTTLRLTLADSRMPFARGRLLPATRQRAFAAAWDGGVVLAIALIAFILIEAFWTPLACAMLCYFLGGIMLLGNTPGMFLFTPRPKIEEESYAPEVAEDVVDGLGSDPAVLLNLDHISS